ncbi:MAG TPA: DUF58 domain-containing protein [Steroidobacteraceae bacterium]|nr:DUF58 domain-containing protein [Steroidobacteraceae bacterium]
MLPSRWLIGLIGGAGVLLIAVRLASPPPGTLLEAALLFGAALAVMLIIDVVQSLRDWRRAPLELERRLPHAFAVGASETIGICLRNPGAVQRSGRYFELADPSLLIASMPLEFSLAPGSRALFEVAVVPSARGARAFTAGQIRLRSSLRLLDWNLTIGGPETRRVFPNFKRQAAFAWLAGDRRLIEMGIRAQRRRGTGTDFDQLVEYRTGDPVRHIDWKATLKHRQPIVRRYQDERDQRVLFLLDCGRRMRADDTQHGIGSTHFDQSLDALMLLAFIALSRGDSVGALTFGTPPGQERRFAPRKGKQTLNALMSALGDVEPTPTFSDYALAAADLLRRQRKRGLVVLITNCRDEDAVELEEALALLRSRHIVILANLREQIVERLIERPLERAEVALDVAAALEYAQRRAELNRRLRITGAMMIDCEPRSLGVELVRHYMMLKRKGIF